MKIAYNPKTATALTTAPSNNDITFDLKGLNIFVKGEKFKGTDTTYSVFKKHTSDGKGGYNGLVPVPSYITTNNRYLREDGTWAIPIDSHYITHLYVGTANGASNNSTSNGNTYIKLYDNSILRNQYLIKGTGKTTVSSDSSGNININTPITTSWTDVTGKPDSFKPSTHYHYFFKGWADTRSVPTTPDSYNGIFAMQGIKTSGTNLGLSQEQVGSYATILGWRGWLDYTGGNSWELASTDKNRLYVRSGSTTTWGNWNAIAYLTDNFPSNQINKLTQYSKYTSLVNLTTTDTLNQALGKLEYKADLGVSAYNIVKAAYDGDGKIENLTEILKVLEGISDTQTIKGILGNYRLLNESQFYGSEVESNFWINRCKENGGGWAYKPINIYKNDKVSIISHYGVYGKNNNITYTYIGSNSYNSSSNLRIYPNGTVTAPIFQGRLNYTYLTGSTSTPNQVIVSTGTPNTWTLKTLGSHAFDSAAYLPITGGTLTGCLTIIGAATDKPLRVRGITGTNGDANGTSAELYLQYGVNKKVMFGNNGSYYISETGDFYNGKSNAVNDVGNGNSITFSYSKSQITYDNFNYLAVWNGYELRTINKNIFALNKHNHNILVSNNLGTQDLSDSNLAWTANVISTNSGTSGYASQYGFPCNNNANGILQMGTHGGKFGGQLGISSNENIYYRFISNGNFPTSTNGASWKKLAFISDLTWNNIIGKPSSFTPGIHKQAYTSAECTTYTSDDNTLGCTPAAVKKAFTIFGPKDHTHPYLPLSGGTMTSNARISHGGNMYIGRSDNGGWIGMQDICSASNLSDNIWSIRTNGNAIFKQITGTRYISTVSTGTQPYACNSTTLNIHLNADLLDGRHAIDFLLRGRMTNPSNGTNWHGAIPFVIALKSAGTPMYTDPEFNLGYNDVSVYNNSGNENIAITRQVDDQGSANSSGYILKIVNNGGVTSPYLGGFIQYIHSQQNAIFAQIFRAKIPIGYNLRNAENSQGTGYTTFWLTDTAGTNKWEWYIRITICGNGGSYSTGGHVYLTGSTGPVTWYLAYCNVINLTKGNYDGLRTKYSDQANSLLGTLQLRAGTFSNQNFNGSSTIIVNIPTHTSHLINNSGFITQHQSLSNYYTKPEADNRFVNITGDIMSGALTVNSTISGNQLISTTSSGISPLKVSSTTVVSNLNSDLLDGYHETSFYRYRGNLSISNYIPSTSELSFNNNLNGSWNIPFSGASGHLVQFNAGQGSTQYIQLYSVYNSHLYWRCSTDSTFTNKVWKTLLDNTNYTQYIQKIGTITKGSPTLPIYLNAGVPTVCNSTLTVSITGNATSANRIISHSINDTLTNKTTPGYLYYAGGSNNVKDKPSGVDAFGVFTMQTASVWYGQLLMSSNTSTGLYWRTDMSFNGGWKKVLDSSNFTEYTVTKTGGGASGTWNISVSGSSARTIGTLNLVAGRFSANTFNGSTNVLVNIPTHTSHLTNDSGFITSSTELSSNITTITKSLKVTQAWMDTGIQSNNLATGTYIIQVYVHGETDGFWYAYSSGVMSWYADSTNDSQGDEIILHRAGHAYYNVIYLRTLTTSKGVLKLQISANKNVSTAYNYTFKFKRVI